MGSLQARYMTKDFATGLAFVERIGASAEEMDHHPDITLTFSDVVVSLRSHDVGGITSRDLRLATRIGEHADDLGVEADVAGLTQPGLGLDTRRHADVAPFYAALLGSSLENGKPVDSTGQVPKIELLNRRRWKTRVELSTAMFEYIEVFYNRQRRHSALGYVSPIQYELASTRTQKSA